jgi:hypothetical protein
MATFEGTVRIRLHPVKGIVIDRGTATSTLTAADAPVILGKMLDAAEAHGVGIDRWSLYIPEVATAMKKSEKQIPIGKIKPYLDGSRAVVLTAGNYGSPRLIVASPVKTVKTSKIVDIA